LSPTSSQDCRPIYSYHWPKPRGSPWPATASEAYSTTT